MQDKADCESLHVCSKEKEISKEKGKNMIDLERIRKHDIRYLWELKAKGFNISNFEGWWDTHWEKTTVNYETLFNKIIQILRKNKIRNVLDIGCGKGTLLNKIKQNIPEMDIFGFEFSGVAFRICEKISGFNGWHGKFPEDISMIDRKFDAVVMTEVLEHIDDDENTVVAVKKILIDNGIFICSVPDEKLGPTQEITHLRTYDIFSLRKLLSKHFKNVEIEHAEENEKLLAICYD